MRERKRDGNFVDRAIYGDSNVLSYYGKIFSLKLKETVYKSYVMPAILYESDV